jgi:hypothetical protein
MVVDTTASFSGKEFRFRDLNDRLLEAVRFGKHPETCSRKGRCTYVSDLIAKGQLAEDSAGLYVRLACEEYPCACELNLPLNK